MDKETLYVVLPCYNEEENINRLIEEWECHENSLYEKGILLKIVVVNDGSSDDTYKASKSFENIYKNVKLLNHDVNKGLGEAINTGISYVVAQNENGFLCIMDADMTHLPNYIFSMINKLKAEDLSCVIASRYRKGSKVEGLSSFRKFLSFGARIAYTMNFRIPNVRDYTCGYRIYRIEALNSLYVKYSGKIVKERGFTCMMELLVKLSREGFKIGEVPFILKYQLKGGKSKMRIWKTVYRSIVMLKKL